MWKRLKKEKEIYISNIKYKKKSEFGKKNKTEKLKVKAHWIKSYW